MSKKKQQAEPDPEFEHLAMRLDELWTALADGDVLRAEMLIARRCDVADKLGIDRDRSDAIFIGMAKQDGKPEGAALLRLIMQMGSPAIKRRARDALGELTARGVYPASWVTEAGKAEPVRARRVYDVSGDGEDVYVTFRYAQGEHTLIARVVLSGLPTVRMLELTGADQDAGAGAGGAFAVAGKVTEEISLAEARARLDPALLRAESSPYAVTPEFSALLPIAKSRLRRLPANGNLP